MTTLLEAMSARTTGSEAAFGRSFDRMEAAPGSGGTLARSLTRSLDYSKEGLAMNATRENCAYPNCDRERSPKAGGGMCVPHYARVKRSGAASPVPKKRDTRRASSPYPMSPAAFLRFIEKVDESDSGCWVWTARVNSSGYGMFNLDKLRLAHRVAYMNFIGPIPEGMTLDHLCRVRACVNPRHLEPVTSRENWERGNGPARINAKKTHCIHGHEFTPENTIPNSGGGRACKTCSKKTTECQICGKTMMIRSRARHYRRLHGMEVPR